MSCLISTHKTTIKILGERAGICQHLMDLNFEQSLMAAGFIGIRRYAVEHPITASVSARNGGETP